MKVITPPTQIPINHNQIKLVHSRSIEAFIPVFPLSAEFGNDFTADILMWCGVVPYNLDSDVWNLWLIECDNTTVGICGRYSTDGKDRWLAWFGILEEYRNQGIGGEVLEQIKGPGMLVYVDEDGPHDFYFNHGFTYMCQVKDFIEAYPEKASWFDNPNDCIYVEDDTPFPTKYHKTIKQHTMIYMNTEDLKDLLLTEMLEGYARFRFGTENAVYEPEKDVYHVYNDWDDMDREVPMVDRLARKDITNGEQKLPVGVISGEELLRMLANDDAEYSFTVEVNEI